MVYSTDCVGFGARITNQTTTAGTAAVTTQSDPSNKGGRLLNSGAGHDDTVLGGTCDEATDTAAAGAIETGGFGSVTIPATAAGGSIASAPAAGRVGSGGTAFGLESVGCAALGDATASFGATSF